MRPEISNFSVRKFLFGDVTKYTSILGCRRPEQSSCDMDPLAACPAAPRCASGKIRQHLHSEAFFDTPGYAAKDRSVDRHRRLRTGGRCQETPADRCFAPDALEPLFAHIEPDPGPAVADRINKPGLRAPVSLYKEIAGQGTFYRPSFSRSRHLVRIERLLPVLVVFHH